MNQLGSPASVAPIAATLATPILRAERLHISRGGRALLRDFNFALHAGEGMHLLGANGAGKTSLLRVLAGLGHADGGQVDAHASILYLGHALGLKPELSVTENLEFFARIKGVAEPQHEIDKALKRIGLAHYFDAPVHTLSAGQRRRIALARLLIEPAQIWLLDEPFAALDVRACAWLCQELNDFLARGGALILTSHQAVATKTPLRELALTAA